MSFLRKYIFPVFLGMELIIYWLLLPTGISGDILRLFLAGLIAFIILLGVTAYLARSEGTLGPDDQDAGTHRLSRLLDIYLLPLILIAADGLYLILHAAGIEDVLTNLLISTVIALAIGLPIGHKLRRKLGRVSSAPQSKKPGHAGA